MNNSNTFSFESLIGSVSTVQYPDDVESDLEMSGQSSSFNMILDDVNAIRTGSEVLEDGEYMELMDFFFSTTLYIVTPTLLSDMDDNTLGTYDGETLFDVGYTKQT